MAGKVTHNIYTGHKKSISSKKKRDEMEQSDVASKDA
jgi:hypothetical protein